ncbi:MAG: PHP domain-containing protein, partial [Immundisolibacteraceae bacterium]|nr:PHP domain-containing protein [Immundisolibacteraceae bacterium]
MIKPLDQAVYAELNALSNFTFLQGASRPEELVEQAAELGYQAIAITDECSLAGVVKAHVAAKYHSIKLLIGSFFKLEEGIRLLLIAPDRIGYGELSGLITLARRRSPKGEYQLALCDLNITGTHCLAIWLPAESITAAHTTDYGQQLKALFPDRLWIGYGNHLAGDQ